ncbi:AAA family ATPase [Agrobacterium vaccinii]|uniref:AAA family ATPase n=1 Tax=Agrobacterium vaccinii TaxID=2735528 RepID=UPI001E5D7188|nr:AAA family ATPase [Agrobacterium vaccinii]UHS61276.1 AAA family ATPase [Agrobacterium vaccinii]
MKPNFLERAASLEVVTYTHAIRIALRKAGAFRRKGLAIGLRLPADANIIAYADATKSVLAGMNISDAYFIDRIGDFYRDSYKWSDAVEFLAVKAGVILLMPADAEPPDNVAVALDEVVAVVSIRPVHLVSAIKTVLDMPVSREEASVLLEFPVDLIFQSLRKGRKIDDAIARLKTLPSPVALKSAKTVGLEELPGYGAAKDWATNLAQDINDWRSGNIAWSDVDTGLLLSGPPGTGKTMFASAVARMCNVEFVAASCAQWQAAGHLGDLLKAMRASFRIASEKAPCILFIDEIDAVGDRAKFSGSNANYCIQVVNGLLEALDGAADREGVVVIAATNHPSEVDPALRRPGRLDRHIVVDLPNYDDRKRILTLHLGVQFPADTLRTAALATGGFSGADLAQLAKDARRKARRAGRVLEPDDLLAAAPPVTPVDAESRHANAVHEAGHVIVGLDVGHGAIANVVVPRSINPQSDSFGHVAWYRGRKLHRAEGSFRDEVAMYLGGMAAEQMVFGETFSGVGGGMGSDLQRATDITTNMVACLGMGSILYHPASTPDDLFELRRADPVLSRQVEGIMQQELERARRILEGRRPQFEMLVQEFIEREVMTGEDIDHVIKSMRST